MQDRNIYLPHLILIALSLLFTFPLSSQTPEKEIMNHDFFKNIEEFPESYNTENVIARFIDGLGFRYFWATEGLRTQDYDYRPSEDGRTTMETMIHLYHLSSTIRNASENRANAKRQEPDMDRDSLRYLTLENFRIARMNFSVLEEGKGKELKIIFTRGENRNEFEIWNLFNGPISDAIWHAVKLLHFEELQEIHFLLE